MASTCHFLFPHPTLVMLGLIDYLVMATYLALLVVIGVRALKAQDHRTSISWRKIDQNRHSRCSGSHHDWRGLARRYSQSCIHARHFGRLVRHWLGVGCILFGLLFAAR